MSPQRRALLGLALQALCCAVLSAALIVLARRAPVPWTADVVLLVLLVQCVILGIHLERFWVLRATERARADDAALLAAWHARHPEFIAVAQQDEEDAGG